ncbi:MAG: (2Fe-2S)-binding protein [Ideonella sp.]|nr:(2Fe-2S)-binding protein [Ideonella sp.]
MIVCVCRRVSDHEIRRAVGQGCSSFAELQQTLGVATACGKCGDCALQTLQAALMPTPKRAVPPGAALNGDAHHA